MLDIEGGVTMRSMSFVTASLKCVKKCIPVMQSCLNENKTPRRNFVEGFAFQKNYLILFHILLARSLVFASKYSITTRRSIVSAVGYCANNCRRVCSIEVTIEWSPPKK